MPSIESLANDVTNRYGIAVKLRIEHGEESFNCNGATALSGIVQEALTNVARHAEASLVTLSILLEDGPYVLLVEGGGHGVAERHAPQTVNLLA